MNSVSLMVKSWNGKAAAILLLACTLACGGSDGGSKGGSPSPAVSPSGSQGSVRSVFSENGNMKVVKGASPSPSAASSPSPKAASQVVSSTVIKSPGENPWTLDTQRIEYNQGLDRARIGRLVWTLLDKSGKPNIIVRADGADLNVKTKGISFDGPVHAEGPDGEKITVKRLVWDNDKRRLLGSHGVRVVRTDSILTGENIVASPDLKKIEVTGNVQVSFPDGLPVKEQDEWEDNGYQGESY